jgi:hypothetical protein
METHSKTFLSAEHLNAASAQLNLPAGPAIVLANLAFLIAAMALGAILGGGKSNRPSPSQLDRV